MESCDVLVIGGGPAGSTVSTLLSKKGWKVVLLEKDHHPRFHIGESLLPKSMKIFQQLGVQDQMSKIGIVKRGAEFVSQYHEGRSTTFYFRGARDKRFTTAYQVRRSEFDHILLNNSRDNGTEVLEGHQVVDVKNVEGKGHQVTAESSKGQTFEWEARYLVDASGRDSFLAKKMGTRRINRHHNSAALYSHFKGAERLAGEDQGNISIFWFDEGWLWMIPLLDGTMSVGAVCRPEYLKNRTGDLDDFFLNTLTKSPELSERLKNAKMVLPVTATSNYSYYSDNMVGDDYILLGDAYAFIDPIFSSGVHLAMMSGIHALPVVEASLQDHPELGRCQKEFKRRCFQSLDTLSWFIYRMTQPAMRDMFMAPKNILGMETAVLSMLAGDVYRKFPINFPLSLFKVIYYIHFVVRWKENWTVYRKRRKNINQLKNQTASIIQTS